MGSYVDELIKKARKAQKVYADFSQAEYDKITRICAKKVYDNAEMFAKEAVEETGMGVVESKIRKQRNLMGNAWYYMKGKKSKGVVGWEKGKLDQDCILKIAKPIGIVGAIMPSTNPTSAMGGNGMQALKGGNAVIFCPHPKAKKVSLHCCKLLREAISQAGAPADLIQVLEEPSIEMTQELIKKVDVVVATGGPGMVKAAYSSGNPALGVGQGNCQVVIDEGMEREFDVITSRIVANRSYDNGIPCTGEQTVIVPKSAKEKLMKAFDRSGAYVIEDPDMVNKLRDTIFVYNEKTQDYILDRKIVGLSAQEMGKELGLDVPADKHIIVAPIEKYGTEELMCREILCPVTRVITYEGVWEEAVAVAKANLLMEGAGHSSDIYTDDEQKQIYAGEELPVCRLIVNNSNKIIGGGSFDNGFVATSTLGCGFWGGSSFDQNLTFEYLLNYTRMYYTVKKEREELTYEEIWGEED